MKQDDRPGLLQAVAAVLSAFSGIRRADASRVDVNRLKPIHILIAALLCAGLLIAGLLTLVSLVARQ